jgi:hypothetical protein
MRVKIALIALAVVALAAPVALGDGLTLRLETHERQKASELKVKITCVDDPCLVEVNGKARVGTRKFALKPKVRSIAEGEPEQFRVRVKKLRKLETLLTDRDGTATVQARGTNADGADPKLKVEITLTG